MKRSHTALFVGAVLVALGLPAVPTHAVCPSILVGPVSLPGGVENEAYAQSVSQSGAATATFAITSGLLPTGLAIDAAGNITGTLDVVGTFVSTVTATATTPPEAVGCTGGRTYRVVVLQAPTAVDDAATVGEDSGATMIDVLANDTDPDSVGKTIASVTQPANGTVVITGGGTGLTYQPNANYCNTPIPPGSADTFTYTLAQGGPTPTATVSMTVTCVDDAPVAVNDGTTVNEDDPAKPVDVLTNDTDPDGGAKTIASVTQPTNGAVVITGGGTGLTYQPNANYCNTPIPPGSADTFTYTLAQGGPTPTATVSMTVTCADDAPVAVNDAATVAEDDPATAVDVLTNDTDADGGPKTIASVIQPANGTVVITGGGTGLTYQPNPNYCNAPIPPGSADTFTYTLAQGGPTPTATVSITVTCVDDAPVAVNDAATVTEDDPATAVDVLTNDTDSDGGEKTIASVTQPANGAAVITGGGTGLTYQPSANYCNTPIPPGSADTFTYTLAQGGPTPTATVSMTVTCVDDPPVAVNDAATVLEDAPATAVDVLSNDTDLDSGPKSIASVTQPANGAVVITGGGTGLTYQPNANYCNTPIPPGSADTFTYTLAQGGPTPTATVSMTVTCVNDAPVAGDDTFDTVGNTELRVGLAAAATPHVLETTPSTVQANDNDPVEGNAIAITGIVGCGDSSAPFGDSPACATANGGTVVMESDGKFSFKPNDGDAAASDSFAYSILDDGVPAAGDNATVTITRFERVWYVDPSAAGGGNGTSASPFDTLDSLDGAGGAGDSDSPMDYIFVHDGSLALSASLPMEANQHLVGEGVGLSIAVNLNGNGSPWSGVPAGTQPQLDRAGSDTVTVGTAIPIEIVGLSLASTTGNAIDLTTAAALTGASTFTIGSNEFRGAGAEGIDVNLNASTTGTLNLNLTGNSWDVAGTHTGNAVDVSRVAVAGTLNLNFSGNTNIESNATAVIINGGAAANTTITGFSSNTIHGNTLGAGVVISNVTFDAVAGGGIQQVDGDNLLIGASGNPVGGAGMSLTTVLGNLFFDDLDIFAGTSGLTVNGAMTFAVTPASPDGSGTSTIDADNGAAVDITSATLDLRLDDMDSTTSGSGVSLSSVAGNFKTDSDASITKASGAGTAFSVGSSSATVTYGGTMNVTSGSGVSLTGNTGSTSFTGQLTISTGANAAFSASGGGTVTATNTTSTLTTTTSTALNVNGTTIGASNLVFRSISSNGAANGIVLSNTGSAGGLTVTGTGAAGTGGVIQNTTGDAISLSSTQHVSLTSMTIQNNLGNGIRGDNVTNFVLASSTVDNNADDAGADEAGLHFTNLLGNASITNTTVANSPEDNARILNSSGTLIQLTITGSTFRDTDTVSPGNNGLLIQATTGGNANITADISTTNFLRNRANGVQVINEGSGTMDFDIGTGVAGSGGAHDDNNIAVNLAANASGDFNFNVRSMTIDGTGSAETTCAGRSASPVNINLGATATAAALMKGTVQNVIATNNFSSTGPGGIRIVSNGVGGTLTVLAQNNTFTEICNRGIEVLARDGSSTLNLTLDTNTVTVINDALGGDAIRIDAGVTASDTTTVCADLVNNTATSPQYNGIRIRQRFAGTTFRLEDYPGSPTDDTAVANFVSALNNAAVTSADHGGAGFQTIADCPVP